MQFNGITLPIYIFLVVIAVSRWTRGEAKVAADHWILLRDRFQKKTKFLNRRREKDGEKGTIQPDNYKKHEPSHSDFQSLRLGLVIFFFF